MGRKSRAKKQKAAAASDDFEVAHTNKLYTIETSEIYGRYLQTNQPVKKGTLFLRESYLIAGPMRSSDVVCVGCHTDSIDRKNCKTCPRCSWPICSSKCADSHFHMEECKFFCEKKIQPCLSDLNQNDFGALMVLRALMLKYQNSEKWKILMNLQHHNEERKHLPLWTQNEINVVEVMMNIWKLGHLFTVDECHTICGILEVNAFEVGDKFSFRGIFPEAAMMAHDCIPNTTHFENSVDGILDIRAAVDMPAGTPLTICYAFSLEATKERRKMLQETKFFECTCKRCNDPYELGTCMSLFKCISCKSGYVINNGAPELTHDWICTDCDTKFPQWSLENMTEKWQEFQKDLEGIEDSEKFLDNCTSTFHPNHFIPFGVKFNLCQSYGRENVPLDQLTSGDLERKLELCREVMKVLDIITPGCTITRGLVLYELQAAEIMVARRCIESGIKINKGIMRRKLLVILKILEESISILELAHSSTSEYIMAQEAKKDTLIGLNKWINSLK